MALSTTKARPVATWAWPQAIKKLLLKTCAILRHAFINILSLALLAVIILFVQSTYSAESRSAQGLELSSLLKINTSTTLAVVQAFQVVLLALNGRALGDSLEKIQWVRLSQLNGLRYLEFLSLSPTTGYMETLRLAVSFSSTLATRAWGVLKVGLTAAIWLSGLVLFINTSQVTVYDTGQSYDVTAGIGPFDGTLVVPFIDFLQSLSPEYPFQVLPYSYFSTVSMLVMDPILSTASVPVRCTSTKQNCVSYLLNGGVEMVTPWLETNEYPDYSLIRIHQAPTIQFDVDVPTSDDFSAADCDIFGGPGVAIGIKLCVAADSSASHHGNLRSGLFLCPQGTDGGVCHQTEGSQFVPNITITASFYTLQATVIAARSNYSIISLEDTTPPTQLIAGIDIDIGSYREALRWLLNYTAANIPAPSSIAEMFWDSSVQLETQSTSGVISQSFYGVLSFPFWLFNANGGGNIDLLSNETISTLPEQFYTQASYVEPYDKTRFDRGMFMLFLVLQGVVMLFTWVVMSWVWVWGVGDVPKTSGYPLLDVGLRTVVHNGSGSSMLDVDTGKATLFRSLKDAQIAMKHR